MHTFSAYLRESCVKERRDLTGAKETVAAVMSAMTMLISLRREALHLAGTAGDEATSTLVGEYIAAMEEDLGMLRTYGAA